MRGFPPIFIIAPLEGEHGVGDDVAWLMIGNRKSESFRFVYYSVHPLTYTGNYQTGFCRVTRYALVSDVSPQFPAFSAADIGCHPSRDSHGLGRF